MEMEGEVTAYEQDRHLACDIRGKAFDLIVDYRISPEGDGTRLTQDTEIMFKSVPMKIIGTLMKPLMAKATRKQQDESFAKLKSLAES
jgi:carbon monoxide dehydrogenase subunit G